MKTRNVLLVAVGVVLWLGWSASADEDRSHDSDAKVSARTLMFDQLGKFKHNPAVVLERAHPFYLVKELVGEAPDLAVYLVVVQLTEDGKFLAGPLAIMPAAMGGTNKEIEQVKRANRWPGMSPAKKSRR